MGRVPMYLGLVDQLSGYTSTTCYDDVPFIYIDINMSLYQLWQSFNGFEFICQVMQENKKKESTERQK